MEKPFNKNSRLGPHHGCGDFLSSHKWEVMKSSDPPEPLAFLGARLLSVAKNQWKWTTP